MTESSHQEQSRNGVLYGLGAYGIWGLFPLYWILLKPATAFEILAHRIVWTLPMVAVLAVIFLPKGWLRRLATGRRLILLLAAAAVITINWGTYIWAVNNDHVTEAALGYYINPIVSILIGVLFLHERLRRLQWVSVGLAAVAVATLTIEFGKPPWVSLVLAFSFGTYGLLKNRVNRGAVETLTTESAMMFLPAAGYLVFLQITGSLTFVHGGLGHSLLLVGSGLVTLVPLLLFASAAIRIPLSMIGLLQYVTPTLQFLLGVLYFGEHMPSGRWIGFALIWAALTLLTTDMLRTLGRQRRAAVVTPEAS
jgi:chloramphenicol-sensitive protein RarD